MLTVLMYTLGVLLFVVGIAVSIGLHEVGHLYPAKKFGVKVTQYFVGFGRTLWSTRRGETEYGVKAIPLGGYVKLVGMLPPGGEDEVDAEGRLKVRKSNTGMFTQVISDARAAEYELVEPGDEDRLFYKLPWWKKVIVMAGGPTVNLVLAFICFGILFMGHGTLGTTVDEVSDCVVAARPGDAQVRSCRDSDPVAPAKEAGLRPGDRIIALNGEEVTAWDQVTDIIRANAGGRMEIAFVRDGDPMTAVTNTRVSDRPSLTDRDEVERVGFLGVVPTSELVRQGPGYVVTTMAANTWETIKAIGSLPVKLYHVGRAALGLEERADDSPMSVVGASRAAGEVTSAHEVPLVDRLFWIVGLLGALNLFLGMFNFVPLLPLDGGHIAGALYEAARRGVARVFRRPDPGYFDTARLLPVAYVMAGAIALMSVVLIYADIVVPVQLG
jgi:membrane-associated protease RseP (regulator of RpoE activity)